MTGTPRQLTCTGAGMPSAAVPGQLPGGAALASGGMLTLSFAPRARGRWWLRGFIEASCAPIPVQRGPTARCETQWLGNNQIAAVPGTWENVLRMVEHEVAAALEAWGAHHRDDPFAVFADVRRRGAVHPVTLVDGHQAWLVVHHDQARAALNDTRLSKDMHAALVADAAVVSEGLPGPAFARHMLTVDPPDHTRLRGLVSRAFSPRRIEGLRPRIQTIVDDLLDGIAADGADSRVDLVSRFAFPLPFTVICELLGVPEQDRAALGRGLTGLLVPTSTPEQYAEAKLASDAVVGLLEQLVEVKAGSPGDDLVSALIAARDGDERLDTRELLSTIFQLIVAGHDTTASFIGNSVVALCRNPDQLALLRGDPERLSTALEEFLRFDAPVPHSTFRYAVEPVELGGVTIPAGAQVIISLAAANRDERCLRRS